MRTWNRKLSQGFSLLEGAIVIAVIGVLIGGIVAGHSLMRAAELRSIATDAKRYMAAVVAFKDKYRGLPGDITNATAFWGAANANPNTCWITNSLKLSDPKRTCNGNGDKRLALFNRITLGPPVIIGAESARFWQQLTNAGLIAGRFPGVYTEGGASGPNVWFNPIPGVDVPASPVDSVGFFVGYVGTLSAFSGWFDGEYGNILWFARRYTSQACFGREVLTSAEASSIDEKFDDGKPGLGNVRAFASTTACAPCVTTTDAATAKYNPASEELSCVLMFPNAF
jgi:hypothetical protein